MCMPSKQRRYFDSCLARSFAALFDVLRAHDQMLGWLAAAQDQDAHGFASAAEIRRRAREQPEVESVHATGAAVMANETVIGTACQGSSQRHRKAEASAVAGATLHSAERAKRFGQVHAAVAQARTMLSSQHMGMEFAHSRWHPHSHAHSHFTRTLAFARGECLCMWPVRVACAR